MPVVNPPCVNDISICDLVVNPGEINVNVNVSCIPEMCGSSPNGSNSNCVAEYGCTGDDPVHCKEEPARTATLRNREETQAVLVQVTSKGMSINIYKECIDGICKCIHVLGNSKTQLKPCRFAATIYRDRVPTDDDMKVFDIVCHGVDIVTGDIPEYECMNYNSILQPNNREKMDRIINDEVLCGALTIVSEKPRCVHAIGAVAKADGGVRPITDCSRPAGLCINDNIGDLPISFKYKSVDNVVAMLSGYEFMGIVDLKSAYRSVSINPSHAKFQGLSWEINGKQTYLVDNRLCFGSKSGPYYFNILSDFVYRMVTEL